MSSPLEIRAMKAEHDAAWCRCHDGRGGLLSRPAPLDAETRCTYSARGDLLGVREALGRVTRYAYDGEGHLTQAVDAKERITTLQWADTAGPTGSSRRSTRGSGSAPDRTRTGTSRCCTRAPPSRREGTTKACSSTRPRRSERTAPHRRRLDCTSSSRRTGNSGHRQPPSLRDTRPGTRRRRHERRRSRRSSR